MNIEHKKYLMRVIFFVWFSLFSLYIINVLVDPLWYFGGNKVFPANYSFNERFSKVNQYLENSSEYDCVIFGSSRSTLLNANKITGFNCFNFSFSNGNPEEFIAYSKYFRQFGGKPKLSIIGVDARFYSRLKHKFIVPNFVSALENPPTSLKTYLSFNTLEFTIRTLFRKAPQQRYYTNELIGAIIPGTKDYNPPDCFTLEGFGLPYTETNLHYTDTLKQTLESDLFVGYVAPVSAWDLLPLLEDGELGSYIRTMYSLSRKFDRFYDFSVPSSLTRRTDNNYDGHHFSQYSNDELALILNGGNVKYGVAVHDMSFKKYYRIFSIALKNFAQKVNLRKKSSWQCQHRSAVR